MKKITLFLLILLTTVAYKVFSQPKKLRSNSTFTQKDHYLNASRSMIIPVHSSFTLDGGLDEAGQIVYNTSIGRIGIYKGSGDWDTLGIVIPDNFNILNQTVSKQNGKFYIGGGSRIDPSSIEDGIYISSALGGTGLRINNAHTGIGFIIDNFGSGTASLIDNNYGGIGLTLNNSTSSNGRFIQAFKNDSLTRFFVTDTGDINAAGSVTADQIIIGNVYNHSGITSSKLSIVTNEASKRNQFLDYFSTDPNSSSLTFAKSRSSSIGSMSYPQSGEFLGRIYFSGADASLSRFENSASINGYSVSNWSSTNHETAVQVKVTPNGSVSDIVGGTFESSGDLTIYGSVGTKASGSTWSNPSDSRLKTNIHDYEKGISELKLIRPVTYNFNSASGLDTTKTHLSIIAQEIEQILPSTVSEYTGKLNGVDTVLKKFDSSEIIWLLVNSLKQAITRIENLESAN